MKHIQKEISIFLSIFLFLSLTMHFNAWMHYPIAHIKSLAHSALGLWHPFIITFIIYSFLWLGRGSIYLWTKIKH